MCIVALAWQVVEDTPICLISNRDEFYIRPSTLLAAWENNQIIAGKDLESGGTWMGVTAQGRWAVVTNLREGWNTQKYSTSRGQLIVDFLNSTLSPMRFAKELEVKQCHYAGFNLIVGDHQQAVYMSNRGEAPQSLARGVYVLSNGLMSEHWGKTAHLRKRFTQEFIPMLQQPTLEVNLERIVWDILEDQRKLLPEELPATGIETKKEYLLSSTFIQSEVYGTRCSNFLRLHQHTWYWLEKTQQGDQNGRIIRFVQSVE